MRDFRIENALFWPHMRNGSYEAFFEQSTNMVISPADTSAISASFWEIDRDMINHPILNLEYDISRVLARMETYGVHIDLDMIKSLETDLSQIIQRIEEKVQQEINKS